jgi:small subunit ribosomal protein S6
MTIKNYETVFILTPILSDQQVKDAVDKFKQYLVDNKAEIVNEESWGLKKLAYPIQNKTTGYYNLIEFKAPSNVVNSMEVEYRRDERIIRFLSTVLDKHSLAYNEKRRSGKFNKKTEEKA